MSLCEIGAQLEREWREAADRYNRVRVMLPDANDTNYRRALAKYQAHRRTCQLCKTVWAKETETK